MAIGTKMNSLKDLKKSMAKNTGGAWIKYVPKNSSMNVRFLQEPEEWINFYEHYDQVRRRSFPCNGETSCPGCQGGERKSSRYLTNALDLDNLDGNGNPRVIALELAKDLANRLVIKYEKRGTLTDCDVELSRAGDGLETVYDYDLGPATKRKMTAFQPLDLMKVLEDSWNSLFGDDDGDDQPVKPSKVTKKPRHITVPDAPPKQPKEKKKHKKSKPVPEPVFDEPDEDEPDEDEEVYDEATLKAMPIGELRALAREFGVEPKGLLKPAIVAAILETGDETDEPPF